MKVRDHIPLEQGLRQGLRPFFVLLLSVRDHIPLEQGLRLRVINLNNLFRRSQRPYSIRTRIKTTGFRDDNSYSLVRDHIPLEQGLRHKPATITLVVNHVRDHIPLEQGLRL